MLTALLFGLGTALPLVIGAAVGLRWKLPPRVLAALMAFGAGTLIAAASNELFKPAFDEVGAGLAGAALVGGALIYVVADHLLENRLGPSALGWALLLGVVLDGVPENLALGVTLDAGEGGLVLLVAIAVGNVPEAVSGAARMRDQHGMHRMRVFALWAFTAVVLVAVTVAGTALGRSISPSGIAVIQAFAGGATIAVLADSLMPEAYRSGGWWVGIATALGFLVAFMLGG
ncbi:MAG: ZIP family metal transporter [Geodermatophilaceae bacterium]|nr:ZIP family metal transporter [Geodermatophilaceae bacterium]